MCAKTTNKTRPKIKPRPKIAAKNGARPLHLAAHFECEGMPFPVAERGALRAPPQSLAAPFAPHSGLLGLLPHIHFTACPCFRCSGVLTKCAKNVRTKTLKKCTNKNGQIFGGIKTSRKWRFLGGPLALFLALWGPPYAATKSPGKNILCHFSSRRLFRCSVVCCGFGCVLCFVVFYTLRSQSCLQEFPAKSCYQKEVGEKDPHAANARRSRWLTSRAPGRY